MRTGWIAENKIPFRIGTLSIVLLGAVVLSTFFATYDLTQNQRRVEDANAEFHRLQIAADAERHFSTMRYWLTDLSLSLLILSEQRANDARTNLEVALEDLARFAPDTVDDVRARTTEYYAKALEAADAYTDDNRVVGNTLLAQARIESDAVSETLQALARELGVQADTTNQIATQDAQSAVRRAFLAGAVIVVAGTLLAWRALAGILVPLGAVNRAIAALNRGDTDIELPPVGLDEFGRMSQMIHALKDSQERRRELEEEARANRNMIVTAIETIPDGFALFDKDDRLVLFNERCHEIFFTIREHLVPGISFKEILAAHVAARAPHAGAMSPDEWIAERIEQHSSPEGFREEALINGVWIKISKRTTPDGGTVMVYSDINDLIERQQDLEIARQDAEAATEAKSQFLASMSHELRTPLNAIIGYSEMLSEEAADMGFEAAVDDLAKIMSSGRHLLSLINDVLDLSKIESGKMELFVEKFALAPLIKDVASTVAPLIAKNGNTLVVSCDLGEEEIETDKTKLRQNLFNLLSNAAKFTTGGVIELSVTHDTPKDQDNFSFAVRDNGIGMTEAQKSKLFQAFVQADASTTRDYGGTGLGLAITQQFIKMMGGTITVETASGAGSTFLFTIPKKPHAAPQNLPSNAVGSDAGARMGRLLIIDDDSRDRSTLERILRDEGYAHMSAGNAEQGMKILRSARPDAVLLDVLMPERDGWSVLREIKSDPEICDIPVIMVTEVADREMGLAFGAVDHLTKPVEAARLIAMLNDIAGDSGREV
ncbi:MAG: ATP-binding protein, partial [Albidovulum sp.]